ncbi:MAG: hypothetical protein SH856_02355 [Flavobacteriales bacterium]|nr:hypothetical protein [Flavobacteriales bacterium]
MDAFDGTIRYGGNDESLWIRFLEVDSVEVLVEKDGKFEIQTEHYYFSGAGYFGGDNVVSFNTNLSVQGGGASKSVYGTRQ